MKSREKEKEGENEKNYNKRIKYIIQMVYRFTSSGNESKYSFSNLTSTASKISTRSFIIIAQHPPGNRNQVVDVTFTFHFVIFV